MVCRYRDNVEFYRHIPAELPATTVLPAPHCTGLQSPPQVFVMPGLDVLDYSTPSHIVLNSVASHTSGDFRCEVTTHSTPLTAAPLPRCRRGRPGSPPPAAPPSSRWSVSASLPGTALHSTADLPTTRPHIFGLRAVYSPGETLNLTCEARCTWSNMVSSFHIVLSLNLRLW